jgi:hypothetical protein
MNKLTIAALLFGLFFAAKAGAQETSVVDVAAGYSTIRVANSPGVSANGGSASVSLNINKWLGATGDFALYHSAFVGSGLAAGTYTFGPRVSYRHWSRFTPFAQALLGGLRYANNAFAFGAGGGADIGLDRNSRFAIRPQVEYFGFKVNGATTNTVRLGISFVVRTGRR